MNIALDKYVPALISENIVYQSIYQNSLMNECVWLPGRRRPLSLWFSFFLLLWQSLFSSLSVWYLYEKVLWCSDSDEFHLRRRSTDLFALNRRRAKLRWAAAAAERIRSPSRSVGACAEARGRFQGKSMSRDRQEVQGAGQSIDPRRSFWGQWRRSNDSSSQCTSECGFWS